MMNTMNEAAPLFLGAYGENNTEFESMLVEFFRDHIFWRRNFHPEDKPPISVLDKNQDSYIQSMARTKEELHKLSAALKRSVPFYNPRYIGHMASDIMLPSLLAHMITTLYNPNNVAAESAPVTVKMELEVGRMLSRLFGFNTDEDKQVCAWGHLTSGGTVANYEGLSYFSALKHYPLALKKAAEKYPQAFPHFRDKQLEQTSHWDLFNLSIDEIVQLREQSLRIINQLPRNEQQLIIAEIKNNRIEHLGPVAFFQTYSDVKPPILIVPITAHYSWEKACKLLGIGTAQLWKVATDDHMRICQKSLQQLLSKAVAEHQPILGVVGVLGTTEFGTLDPIDKIVALRQRYQSEGLNYFIHVDAAWGGYLTSMFRNVDGSLVDYATVSAPFNYFPSKAVHATFAALKDIDSATIDPHKLGYIQFGCGAYIARNREMCHFVTQEAPYVFDPSDEPVSTGEQLQRLGQYIFEGSKPGSAAAAVYVSHQVMPLHRDAFGQLMIRTIKTTELFYDLVQELAVRLKDKVTLAVPFDPDSNLICLTFNPVNNKSLVKMNRFTRSVFQNFKIDERLPVQVKQYIGSYTSILRRYLSDDNAERLASLYDFDLNGFVKEAKDEQQADHIYVFRHTLMNPWLLEENQGRNYIEGYIEQLEQSILQQLEIN